MDRYACNYSAFGKLSRCRLYHTRHSRDLQCVVPFPSTLFFFFFKKKQTNYDDSSSFFLDLNKAYSFLDPNTQGKLLAAYIVGIAVGQCIIFSIVNGAIYLREWIVQRRKKSVSDYSAVAQPDSDVA